MMWFKSSRSSRQKIVAIDLGTHVSKAVHLAREGDQLVLLGYVLEPALPEDLRKSPGVLSDHIRKLHEGLDAKTRDLVIALSPSDGILRNIEMLEAKPDYLRRFLKLNSKAYLQQELGDHEFDCAILPPVASPVMLGGLGLQRSSSEEASVVPPSPASRMGSKAHVLVGSASQRLVENLVAASREAGLFLKAITFTQTGLIHAARHDHAALLKDNAVAVVDIGYESSTITIFLNETLALNRVIAFGAQHLTNGLASSLGITQPVAEGIKVTMPDKVFAKLQKAASPLIEELRASIDFFEQLHERVVTHALLSGGSARSDAIIRLLQDGLVVQRCQRWEAAAGVAVGMPEAQRASLETDAAHLTGAICAARAWFEDDHDWLNLLADRQEQEEARRRDPVKLSLRTAALLAAGVMLWAGFIQGQVWSARKELDDVRTELSGLKTAAEKVDNLGRRAAEAERLSVHLNRQSAERFLWTAPLNELQFCMVEGIDVVRARVDELIQHTPATKPVTNANHHVTPGKPAVATSLITMTITARDFGNPPATEKFVSAIAQAPYFKQVLREEDPVLLRDRMAQQVDPLDPSKRFVPFTIECVFKERVTRDE